jgi:GT2 family glycosyltransferase
MTKIVIIVLTWNGWEDTRRCLESLAANAPEASVLVVDNGSTDGTPALVAKEYPEVELLENGANLGYAAGNNRGIEVALRDGADFVCVLNNDADVREGFLAPLLQAFADRPTLGAASPLIERRDGDGVWFDGAVLDPGTGIPIHSPVANPLSSVVLTGCCLIVPRHVFEQVGGFDERYFLIFEDADWSLRVRAAGFDLLVVRDSRVAHGVSASFRRDRLPTGDFYFVRNALHFLARHSPSPWCHGLRFVWRRVLREGLRDVARAPVDGLRIAGARLLGVLAFMFGCWGRAPWPLTT